MKLVDVESDAEIWEDDGYWLLYFEDYSFGRFSNYGRAVAARTLLLKKLRLGASAETLYREKALG